MTATLQAPAPTPQKRRKAMPELVYIQARFPPKVGLDRRIIHLWDGLEGAAYRVNYYDKERQKFPECYFVLVKGPNDLEISQ